MAECCGITIKQIGALAFTFVLSAFWSTVMTFKMIYDIFRNGWDSFSYRKARTQPPEVLTKGWNHDYVKLSNVTLHYVSSGSRDKPLMLFLHGFPEFWYSWRHQMREFQDDYRVVAVDMRGYGQSDKPSGRFNYKIEVLAQDVNELVHSLGYNSCILVAHDWGGAVAWNTASYYPEIVDKLIIMNCPNNQAFGKHLSKSRTQLLKSWYMFFFQCPCLPEFFMRAHDYKFIEDVFRGPESGCRNPHAFSDEDIEAWKYTFSQPGALTPPINYYRAAFTRCDRPPSPASNIINPPTLIIWGTKDVALETPLAALSAEFCRDATVKYIEGASHWVQQDEPALCSSYMRKFLTKDD